MDFLIKGVDFENYELLTSVLSIGSEIETEKIQTRKTRDEPQEEQSDDDSDDDLENQVINF